MTEFSWIHLSAGDLLRDERKKNGPHAAMIEECIVQGKIVPAELTVELLKNAIMDNTQNGKTQFLVDGSETEMTTLACGFAIAYSQPCQCIDNLLLDLPSFVLHLVQFPS